MVVYFKTLCIYDGGFERERLILRKREQRMGRLRMKTEGDLPVPRFFFKPFFFKFYFNYKNYFFLKRSNLMAIVTKT